MTLVLKDVVYRVNNQTHIHPINLELGNNGFNILLGTTLAGKTSLLHLIAGLTPLTEGEIWLNGQNLTHTPVQKRKVAMVYQQFINYAHWTVFENIASPLRLTKMSFEKIKHKVYEISELLQLTPFLQQKPTQLSGGQQQRTALARALVKDADLILLDEPLANLDFKLREELREELPKLFKDKKSILVYTTSEPAEALLLAGHTAVLCEGQLAQFGETAKIYREPKDLRTAKVFSDPLINTVKINKVGGQININNQVSWPIESQNMPDGGYTLGIRPHHITLKPNSPTAVPINVKVLIAEISGSETTIHFDLGGLVWVSQSRGVISLEVGTNIEVFLNTDHCLYFDSQMAYIKT